MANQSSRSTMSRSDAGRRGAEALNSDPQKKSQAAKKAAETRKAHNPNAFREMGATGGAHSHGGGRSSASKGSKGRNE
jgi:hypothetical protein